MIDYLMKKSWRARCMRITVKRNGEVVVTSPAFVPAMLVDNFVRRKQDWIKEKVDYFLKKSSEMQKIPRIDGRNKTALAAAKKEALILVTAKAKELNGHYNFSYGKISIRNQKSRWGSCSKSGNLSFNYRLKFLPTELIDYVVVHELCHLKEFNHSKAFWDLVGQRIPAYVVLRKRLREIG